MYKPQKRRAFTKAERAEVYEKTSGLCAYCGCEIPISGMQVDHVFPIRLGGADDMANLLPACRSCNHYKGGELLGTFRRYVEKFPETLARDSVTYRNAVRFGLVVPKPRAVVFEFERIGIKVDEYGNATENGGTE